jgi:type I restriction enzyme S subunit
MGSRTIFKAVTKEDVLGITVLKAQDVVANRLKMLLSPMFRELEVLFTENQILRHSRDLVLPKLISGEIPVEAAEDTAAELIEQTA